MTTAQPLLPARRRDRWRGRITDDPRAGLKRYLPRTLFGRSLMIVLTPMMLALGAATFYFYDRHWDSLTDRLANGVAGEVSLMVEEYVGNPDPAARAALFDQAERNLQMIITKDVGRRVGPQRQPTWREPLRSRLFEAMHDRVQRPFAVDAIFQDQWTMITVEISDGALTFLVPHQRLFTSTGRIFIYGLFGVTIGLFAVAIIFLRNQIRPIRRLALAADGFGKGHDVPEFRVEGAAEVRQAARAFLVMRERIRRQIAQRTEMLAGVSHDLRTPLTRMRLQLELMGDAPGADEMVTDIADMERMIEAYLAFARGAGNEAAVRTDLVALIREAVGKANRAGTKGEFVDYAGPADLTATVRPMAIGRCLGNLLSNAGRHAAHVQVTLHRIDTVAEILIDDNGPGIPENQRAVVFRPFYRLDTSRNLDTGGAGLGLTIARDVARGHGGDLRLETSPQGGLRCRLRIPL